MSLHHRLPQRLCWQVELDGAGRVLDLVDRVVGGGGVTSLPSSGWVLSIVVCGAGPASGVGRLVRLAHERGWRTDIIATPSALPFLDVAQLADLVGHPVRSEYSPPGEPRTWSLPEASAYAVAPATYNTICKLALGVCDTYALGVLAEAIGRRVPVVILPFVNQALAARRPFETAVESLRGEGVRILLGRGGWVPHPPGTGGERLDSFPWAAALDAAESRTL